MPNHLVSWISLLSYLDLLLPKNYLTLTLFLSFIHIFWILHEVSGDWTHHRIRFRKQCVEKIMYGEFSMSCLIVSRTYIWLYQQNSLNYLNMVWLNSLYYCTKANYNWILRCFWRKMSQNHIPSSTLKLNTWKYLCSTIQK